MYRMPHELCLVDIVMLRRLPWTSPHEQSRHTFARETRLTDWTRKIPKSIPGTEVWRCERLHHSAVQHVWHISEQV